MALSLDHGRVALVRGGSHGIGAATVRRLAAAGWDISFCYYGDGQSARKVEKDASELGVRVAAIQADVTDPERAESWFAQTEDVLGPVEAVVSCAGITRDRPLTMLADDDWRAVIDTGLDGVFHLCRAAVFAMMKRRSGRIVTVSSVCEAYDHAAPDHDITFRPGIAGFIGALASQTGRYGVSVNAIVPGPATRDLVGIMPEHQHSRLAETIALRRFGDAGSVADQVAFLLSDAARHITGRVLEACSTIGLLAALSLSLFRTGRRAPQAPDSPAARRDPSATAT